jgi:hypothetical protein
VKVISYIIDVMLVAAVVGCTVVGFAGYELEAFLAGFVVVTLASWRFFDSSAWFRWRFDKIDRRNWHSCSSQGNDTTQSRKAQADGRDDEA